MVDSFGEIGKSFICLGREMVLLQGVSSLGISASLIRSLMLSPPAFLANSSSKSSSSSAGSLSGLLLSSLGSDPDLVFSMSKM